MADNKTIRRSRRLAAKKVRSRKRQTRLSVGEVLGVTPRGGKAVNLHEARAIQMGREAATSHDDTRLEGRKGKRQHGKTRRSRGSSLPPRAKPTTSAESYKRNEKARSVHGTPRRASQIRNSLDARELTKRIFDSSDETDGDDTDDGNDTPPPPLDDDDSGSSYEGKEEKTPSTDTRLSLIVTPMSERAKWEPEDDDFIAPEGEATVYGDDDDDYVPSMSEDSEPHIEEVMEPHARKPDIPKGEKASGSELDGIRVTARYNSMEAQPPTPKTKKKKKKKQRQPVRRKPHKKPDKTTKKHKKHMQ